MDTMEITGNPGTVRDFMSLPMLRGREIEISMPNGEKRKAQFAIVGAGDIIASHDARSFSDSPGYPTMNGHNINDRNYHDDKNAQAKVIEMAQHLDPNILISTSRTPAGTPIITTDGFVVSGNNRTMSLKLAIEDFPEKYAAYLQFLHEEMFTFGFDRAEYWVDPITKRMIDRTGDLSIFNPILVRIDYDFPTYNTTELSKYNKDTKKSERPIDKAIKMGKILSENDNCKEIISSIVGEFETFSEFYSNFSAQKKLVDTLISCNIITSQELSGYFMETGFTAAGKDLIENLLAGLVLTRDALISSNIEGVKAFRSIIITCLPVLVKNGTLGPDTLILDISDAIVLQAAIAQSKHLFEDYVRQTLLFGLPPSKRAVIMNRLLSEGRNRFKSSIENYNQSISDNQHASLFGDKPSSEEIFQTLIESKLDLPDRELINKQYPKPMEPTIADVAAESPNIHIVRPSHGESSQEGQSAVVSPQTDIPSESEFKSAYIAKLKTVSEGQPEKWYEGQANMAYEKYLTRHAVTPAEPFQYKFQKGDTVRYKGAEQVATIVEPITAPDKRVMESYSIQYPDGGIPIYAYADDLEPVAASANFVQVKTDDVQPEVTMTIATAIITPDVAPLAPLTDDPEFMERMAETEMELLTNDGWFKMHPEKILGETYERSGRFGKEIAVRGTLEDALSRIDADLVDQQAREDQPLETIIEPSPEESLTPEKVENIKRALKKSKVHYAERTIATGETQMQTFDEILRQYNPDISLDEIMAFVWYKSHIGDPLSGQWNKYMLHPSAIEDKKIEWLKAGIICWHKGDFMPSYLYYAENIYERISELNQEKDAIIEKFGQEQYDKQLSGLQEAKHPPLTLTAPVGDTENRRLVILPISKFARETYIFELRDGTTFDSWNSEKRAFEVSSKSLTGAFVAWVSKLPSNDIKNGTNAVEIERYYIDDSSFPRDTPKEEKLRVKQRSKQEGERLFSKFLAEELLPLDQTKIEYKWNSTFNGYRDVNYDKVPIAFECSKYFQKEELFIKPEKREGAAFVFANGSGCIAYDVGVGKTITALFTMAQYLAAGYAKRILCVVPNQTYAQWIQECKGKIVNGEVIYNGVLPQIPINDFYNLGAGYGDKLPENKMVAEGSITFITYEGMEQLGISDDNFEYFSKFIYDIVNQGTESSRDQSKIMEKVEKAAGRGLKNAIFNIEDFGFDFICFDEAHKMKKSFTQVKGEVSDSGSRGKSSYSIQSGTPSDIAIKGLMLAQYVFQNNNQRNIMLLTATPFTNSPLEIYSMLALIGYQRLKREGLNNINEFFNTFVKTSTELTISPRLKPERKEIVMGFNNLITLQQLIFRFINYKTGEDVGVERPNKIVLPLVNRRNPVSGQMEVLPVDQQVSTFLPMTNIQQEYMRDVENYIRDIADLGEICNRSAITEEITDENEATQTAGIELSEGSMNDDEKKGVRVLRGLSYAKLLALSPHLYPCSGLGTPTYKEYVEQSPKFSYTMDCIRSVKKYHEEHGEPMSGQIIYMNTGIDYFGLLKDYLVYEIGFKPGEIGIIRSGMSAMAKNRIKDKFNDGEIHVVIGSATIKEGINLQKRSTVLYNLYLDWNPTDVKQLEGRLWRFGNEFENVRIATPMMENSIDSFIFQKLEEKTSRINEIWSRTNKQNDLKLEEFNPAELKMGLITDPRALAELILMQDKERMQDEIQGIEGEIELLKSFDEAKKDYNSDIREFDRVVEQYRPARVDKDSGIRESRKLNTKISLFEDIIKTGKDSEGNTVYLDYQETILLRTIRDAIRMINRVERTYLIPKGLSSDINVAEYIVDLNSRIEELKNKLEKETGEDKVAEIAKDIEAKRKAMNQRRATVAERVTEFARLNNLLSIKKIYSKKEPSIIPATEKKLAKDTAKYTTCPPMTADGKRSITPEALGYLEKCIASEPETKNAYFKNGQYTPARQALHKKIIASIKEQKPCIQEKPIAVLTGGAPGAGKTRFLKTHARWLLSNDVYHIDADEVRAQLPEYKGWNAPATHQETKDIVDALITEIGFPCKHDLVYDGTMNKAKNYLPLIDRLKSLGYDVFIIYMNVPMEVSEARVLERYQRTGRYVPHQVIEEVYDLGANAFDMLKDRVDGYVQIDGVTNEIISTGGKEIPENRNYKLSDGTGPKKQLSTDDRKKELEKAITGYRTLLNLERDKKKKLAYKKAIAGYQTLKELA